MNIWNAGGTAKDWYEAGITASMTHHGVDAATTAAYIASSAENTYGTTVAFDNNSGKSFNGSTVDDAMSKIITQKYLALFPDGGWEAWADHRRLHLPVLIPRTMNPILGKQRQKMRNNNNPSHAIQETASLPFTRERRLPCCTM